MTKLPVVKGRECITVLQRGGFVIDRQKGSHITLIRDDPFARATVPNHNKPLKPGTLRSIIRQAGLTVDGFLSCFNFLHRFLNAPQPTFCALPPQ